MKTSRKKILIVDDEAGFAMILKIALEETGEYDVQVEVNGLQGYKAAQEFKPDLVLLDIRMPDNSGPEVAAKIRENRELSGTSLIFISATPFEESVKHFNGKIAGYPYITKPAGSDEIIHCIQQVLSDNGGKKR